MSEPLKGKEKYVLDMDNISFRRSKDFFEKEDVAGAVQWLKTKLKNIEEVDFPITVVNFADAIRLIDEAFEDVTKEE